MSVWLILLIVYVLVFIGFLIAMCMEAPKHGTSIGVLHILVALIWPVWLIWYVGATISDTYTRWLKRRKKK